MWLEAEVVEILEEMIRWKSTQPFVSVPEALDQFIQDNNYVNQWIEMESDSLAPHGAYTKNEREDIHSFLVDLYAYIQKNQK